MHILLKQHNYLSSEKCTIERAKSAFDHHFEIFISTILFKAAAASLCWWKPINQTANLLLKEYKAAAKYQCIFGVALKHTNKDQNM